MQKFEPIARLNIIIPNMVKQGLMYSKQNLKWMLGIFLKNENIGSYAGYTRKRTGVSAAESSCQNHHAVFENISMFYILIPAENVVKFELQSS